MSDELKAAQALLGQFQFCITKVAQALGGVCCGGVDSSPEAQMRDPNSTTRVLCDAIAKLEREAAKYRRMKEHGHEECFIAAALIVADEAVGPDRPLKYCMNTGALCVKPGHECCEDFYEVR